MFSLVFSQSHLKFNFFSGITLKFCVSDLGLECLLNCQQLRKITMNKITNHSAMPANRGITLDGVRKLVRGLPNLEIISFGSMGKILQSNDFQSSKREMKLIHFTELDPEYVQVDRLAQLCPYLAHINLSVPITINPNGNIDTHSNGAPCIEILQKLADSQLPLKIIELYNFPYCSAFESLLLNKGSRLQELLLRATNNLNSKHLILIGKHCKHLQKLHLKELGPEDEAENAYLTPKQISSLAIYQELVNLHLSGRGWNAKVVLPIMLMSAKKLTKLSLMNMSSRMSMDPAWTRILSVNPLPVLTSISLYSGCFISIHMVRKLALECPRLTFFSFIQSENIELAEVERLRSEININNLNIKLCCLEMFDV